MKKTFLFVLLCLMALSINAQRCAVLEFKAGVGISQDEVDGISAIFITYFRPAGYTMVERTQIDRVIDEQGFQRSKMTENQMVRIGQILNVSKIVIGDVNIVMGQYNVDVRVINVESGTIAATEGATFDGSSYRASMQNIAQELASQIALGTMGTSSGEAGENKLLKELTDDTYINTIIGNKNVVLELYTTWCGPCKRYDLILSNLYRKYTGDVVFCKINVEKSRIYSSNLIPVLYFYKDGVKVGDLTGLHSEEDLIPIINQYFY